jgi:hypothetical protein
MNSISSTVCVRCGKPRIILSVKEELLGTSTISTMVAICPDPDCQKLVDGILSAEEKKRHISQVLREEKMLSRKHPKAS